MTKRVLVTCPQMQKSIDRYLHIFAEHGLEVEAPPLLQQMSEDELCAIIDRFDGVIAGDDPFTAKVMDRGTKLQIISKWGVGIDGIDLEAAMERGIKVTNTPGTFGNEVADVTIGYLILLARQLHRIDQLVRGGEWGKIQGTSLAGKILGVVGLGSIGRAVVKRAVAMEMNVIGFDVAGPQQTAARELGAQVVELAELIKAADFIALGCPLTKTNRHMLSDREFAMMKDGVSIINTARGPLIDESALVKALALGKVKAAALDVFEEEPLPTDSPLRQFEQCIFGAHNSSNTLEGTLRVNELALKNLLEGLGVK